MWRRNKRAEAGLDTELRYHFERLVRDFIASGVEPDEARRRARLEFGGLEQIKEDCRDVRGRWLQDLFRDLRYTARTLRRSPGFLAVAVLSLALGIGANTAIFTLIDTLMLRSLPVKDPSRLVQVTRLTPSGKPGVVSYPLFEYFRDHMKSIAGAAAELSGNPMLVVDGALEVVNTEMVSGGYFALLGVEPATGRLLTPADDTVTSAAPAAVIGYRYWQRRFGLNPDAIGKTFVLQNKTFTIVGVTPPQFQGTRPERDPDITLPLLPMLSDTNRQEPTNNMLSMMGRLAPGVTVEQANAEQQVLWQSFLERLTATFPAKDRPGALRQRAAVLSAATGFNALRDFYAEALLVLMGIVGLVLLLACANVSGLLLARAASRQREISIRLAIGAGRGRLIRQFLAESLLLAVLGGGAGFLLAPWLNTVLIAMMSDGGRLLIPATPDWRVLAFTGAISLAACLLAGSAPGWYALRTNLNPGLKVARTGGLQRMGKALATAQLSISMVLLVGAALFVGTLVKLYRVDLGMQTDGILMFTVRSIERFPQARSWAVQSAVLDRLRATPGVVSASAVQVLPISGSLWGRTVQVEGYTFRSDESEDSAFNAVAPGYFATTGIPLLRGREFDRRDTNTGQKVAIVNESFARYFFGDRSPVGHWVSSVNVRYEIVGEVKDARYSNLRQDLIKTMYIPWTQREGEQPSGYAFLARVAAGDPMRLAPAIERLVRETDPALRVRNPQTYAAVVDRSIATERIMATLGGFFGLLAILVAGLGIFGVMAFQVSRRVNEIGIRMALGARRRSIVALILREIAVMLAVGCPAGAAVALALSGIARKMLFGVTPTEPAVFVLAAVVLGAAALAAGWLPARRAARVDPMVALRHE
jgi:predicted permease